MTGVSRHSELVSSRATSGGWERWSANRDTARFAMSADDGDPGLGRDRPRPGVSHGDVRAAPFGARLRRSTERYRQSASDRRRRIGSLSHRLSRAMGHFRKRSRAVRREHPTMSRRTGLVTAIRPHRWPANCAATLFIAAVARTRQMWQPAPFMPHCCIAAGRTRAAGIDFVCSDIDLPSDSHRSIERPGMHRPSLRRIWRAMD